ncbi:MAG: tripartite tricarboxylate transporter substrate binding protein [Burkholderiales bacterium]|nr:tripartite tricarboxylate transporter substrate binding protein [Burkholderiales bacterium]
MNRELVEALSPRRCWIRHAAAALALFAFGVIPHPAQGADYPNRTIKMLVPFAPGGSTDMVARIVAVKLATRLGQPVVVENRPGAGTAIAMQAVARAVPDGYTLLFSSSALANYPSLTKNVVLDVQHDLVPVTTVVSAMYVVLVHPSVPARTVPELITLAKSRPGQLNIGSAGSGSANHLAGELFKSAAGIDLVHVQYKGSGPALIAAIAGEVQVIIEPIISARAYIDSGRLRALAVTGDRRSIALPDLPTVAESGVPGFEASFWLGVLAPPGISQDIVATLAGAIGAILKDPEVKAQLVAQGTEPIGDRPDQFARRIAEDIAKWGKVIRDAKVQMQ